MRITSHMLSESARKAGIFIEGTSLLDHLNKTGSAESSNSLLDALEKNNKNSSAVSSAKKGSYEKIEKAADEYEKTAEKFAETSENSMFAKARETGEMDEIYENVERLVERFNSAAAAMRFSGDSLDAYYLQMFKETALEQSTSLSEIGIYTEKSGSLNLDKEKLKAADLDTIETVLGANSAFVTRSGYVAGRASDHAAASVKSITSQYDALGNTYFTQAGQYDFFG